MDATNVDRTIAPKTVREVLEGELGTHAAAADASPTGYGLLDQVLGGGLRPGELTLVGGGPGVGKTVCTLQWARNAARAGAQVVYACYEHEESDLATRLLALELGDLRQNGELSDAQADQVDALAGQGRAGVAEVLADPQLGQLAREAADAYADRLQLVRASGAHTGVEELRAMLPTGTPRILFVDYLQKVAVTPEPEDESDKVRYVAEHLKDLALTDRLPIVCVVAVDRRGLGVSRLRLHHFRGSSALAFESDVVLVLNEKRSAVAKAHLAYDPLRAATFGDYVVFSVEKNRGGTSRVDVEFRKDFPHYRFDPDGGVVGERLVDERLDLE